MVGFTTKPRALAWERSSRYLAVGGGEEVTIWDCGGRGPANRTPTVLEVHEGYVRALAYQPGGPLLLSGGADGRIALWRPEKGTRPLALGRLEGQVTALAWSPDGRCAALGNEEGDIVVVAPPA